MTFICFQAAFRLLSCCVIFLLSLFLRSNLFILFYLLMSLLLVFVFFFSSRRRHTRCLSDWSSDVCSSDLRVPIARSSGSLVQLRGIGRRRLGWSGNCSERSITAPDRALPYLGFHAPRKPRSEERRVGKECRSRWSPYREKQRRRERRK